MTIQLRVLLDCDDITPKGKAQRFAYKLSLAVARVIEHAKEVDIAGAEVLNADIGQTTVEVVSVD